mmetsp:Transcript_12601/g.29634  ORF Transcript_12601/g.29634 Transcript_12601/m.29634 type:complete len:187 (-) Transcript_12601:94-654(-)
MKSGANFAAKYIANGMVDINKAVIHNDQQRIFACAPAKQSRNLGHKVCQSAVAVENAAGVVLLTLDVPLADEQTDALDTCLVGRVTIGIGDTGRSLKGLTDEAVEGILPMLKALGEAIMLRALGEASMARDDLQMRRLRPAESCSTLRSPEATGMHKRSQDTPKMQCPTLLKTKQELRRTSVPGHV